MAPLAWLIAALALGLVQVAGCSRSPAGEAELQKLHASIVTYEEEPSEAHAKAVEVAFAELDTEIAKLEAAAVADSAPADGSAKARAEQLARERYELRNRYAKAIVAGKVDAAGEALKSLGSEIGRGLEAAGKSLQKTTDAEKPAGE